MNDTVKTEAIGVTRQQLQEAFRIWEQNHRAGKTRSYAETQALPIEQVVRESADYVWGLLGGH